jgi:hypothetical protein
MAPNLNTELAQIKDQVYDPYLLQMSNFTIEAESKEYGACKFQINGRNIICRNAKLTPTKSGQFVTFWKRKEKGPIQPFSETDQVDFYVVNVRSQDKLGQFVFPKSVLIQQGIISTKKKEGKRAFRVYPSWDLAKNNQAQRTQKWQLFYFYEIGSSTDMKRVVGLYTNQ